MTILFDIDSLIYSSACNVDTFDDATNKFDEIYMSTINDIEGDYDILHIRNFGVSRGNFRKRLDPNYKANRTHKPPEFYHHLCHWVVQFFNVEQGYGEETDDLVARAWREEEVAMIVSIDKDYKQLPCLYYNYIKKEYYEISEQEALKNFYTQMITGDSADNVKICKGYGEKYANRIFENCKTEYQFMRETFKLYKHLYKSKAREKYILCYKLLKL